MLQRGHIRGRYAAANVFGSCIRQFLGKGADPWTKAGKDLLAFSLPKRDEPHSHGDQICCKAMQISRQNFGDRKI